MSSKHWKHEVIGCSDDLFLYAISSMGQNREGAQNPRREIGSFHLDQQTVLGFVVTKSCKIIDFFKRSSIKLMATNSIPLYSYTTLISFPFLFSLLGLNLLPDLLLHLDTIMVIAIIMQQ